MRKIKTLIYLLFVSIAVSANSEIVNMIQANSDVSVSVTNDSTNPWSVCGKDSLQSNGAGSLILSYYSTEYTELSFYGNRYVSVYINNSSQGTISSKKTILLKPGENVIRFYTSKTTPYIIKDISVKRFSSSGIDSLIESKSDVQVEIINDSITPWMKYLNGSDTILTTNVKSAISFKYQSDSITELSFGWSTNSSIQIYIDSVLQSGMSEAIQRRRIAILPGEHIVTFKSTMSTYTKNILHDISIKECDSYEIKNLIEEQSDVKVSVINDPNVLWKVKEDKTIMNDVFGAVLSIQFETDYITTLSFDWNTNSIMTWSLDGAEYTTLNSDTKSILRYLAAGKHTISFKCTYNYSEAILNNLSIKKVHLNSDIDKLISNKSDVAVETFNDDVSPWYITGGDTLKSSNSGATIQFVYKSDFLTELNYLGNTTPIIDGENKSFSNYNVNSYYLLPGEHTIAFKSKSASAYIYELFVNELKPSEIEEVIEDKSNVEVHVTNNVTNPWTILGTDTLRCKQSGGVMKITFETDSITKVSYSTLLYVSVKADGKDIKSGAYLSAGKHEIVLTSTSINAYISGLSINRVCDNSHIENILSNYIDVPVKFENDSINPVVTFGTDSLLLPPLSSCELTIDTDYITELNINYSSSQVTVSVDNLKKSSSEKKIVIPAGKHTIKIASTSSSTVLYVYGYSIKSLCNANDIENAINRSQGLSLTVYNDTISPWYVCGQDSLTNNKSGSTFKISYKSDYITELYYAGNQVIEIDEQSYSNSDEKYIYIQPGSHSIVFIQNSSKGSVLSGISIKEIKNELEELIYANSDVVLRVINDTISPWTVIGKDSISNQDYGAKMSIEYESDNITEIHFNTSYSIQCSIDSADMYYSDKPDHYSYLNPGKHIIIFKSSYSSIEDNLIKGIYIKEKLYTAAVATELMSAINKTTNVNLQIMNDSYSPWWIENGKIVNDKKNAAISFLCESEYQTELYLSITNSCDCYIDNVKYENVNYVRQSLGSGIHTITIIPDDNYKTEISNLSIEGIETDEIEEMIESLSEVEVEIMNDPAKPWKLIGQDSLSTAMENGTIGIKYTSNKRTEIHIDWLFKKPQIIVDGEVCSIQSKTTDCYLHLEPGTHEIQLVSKDKPYSNSNDPYYGYIIINSISVNEIDAMDVSHVDFLAPSYPEYLYDFDEDGILEWSKNDIYDINMTNYQVEIIKNSHNNWLNINNDKWLDGYQTTYDDDIVYVADSFGFYNQHKIPDVDYYVDFNNDGYPDIVNGSKATSTSEMSYAYTFVPGNGFVKSGINLISVNEYNNIPTRKNRTGIISQSASQALSFNNIVRSKPSTGRNIHFTNVDFNGDGIEDCVTRNKVLQNIGDGTIVEHDISGDFADIDNNGVMDAISYENGNIVIYMMNRDWTYTEYTIYSGAPFDDYLCYDFNKDNRKDILLVFNYTEKFSGSYLILLTATENGDFESYEYFYANKFRFKDCVDIDADGFYELFCMEEIGDNSYRIAYFDIDGTNISERANYFDSYLYPYDIWYSEHHYNVLDIDNDGIMELSFQTLSDTLGVNSYQHKYNLIKLSKDVNQRPSKPDKPNVVYEPSTGGLSITWAQGTDKETSSVDLTYALRIGTEPGKGNVVYAHALTDGTRKNLMGGNQSTNRFRLLNTNTWKAGKYYISIQVVDPNNRGSEFSEEVIFEKNTYANAFTLLYDKPFGVGDTCKVQLHQNVLLSKDYSLKPSHGRVVEDNEDKSVVRVVFDKPGLQTISLTSVDLDGYTGATFEETIEVNSVSMNKIDSDMYITVALDMNEDGLLEYFVDKEGFHEANLDGVYNRITKMYNNHTLIVDAEYNQPDYVLDINKDGRADMFANMSYFNSSSWYTMINTGNKNMSINTNPISFNFFVSNMHGLLDMNNDGNLEIVAKSSKQATNRPTQTTGISFLSHDSFDNIVEQIWLGNIVMIRDLTNDGLLDLLVNERSNTGDSIMYYLYRNASDFTFVKDAVVLTIPNEESLRYIEDLDNDGFLDMITSQNNAYYVRWSDGTMTELDGITSVYSMDLTEQKYRAFDYNNDGYWDLKATGGMYDEDGVLLFLPNHQYQFISGYNIKENNIPFVTSDSIIRVGDKKILTHNSRPEKPVNLSVVQNNDGIYIRWEHSMDSETPECNMRYNISVKHKNKSGVDSYLISPCNSTKNGVHVPSTLRLVDGNTYFVPIASIPVGEYQVQVQGVDMQNLESEFSDVLDFKVLETSSFDIPAVIEEGVKTTIKVMTNQIHEIDWDGGQVITSNGNEYVLVWDNAGSKTISTGGVEQTIYVYPVPDAQFTMPDKVLVQSTVKILTDNAKDGSWKASADGINFKSLSELDIEIISIDKGAMVIRFNQPGVYILAHTTNGAQTEVEYKHQVEVSDQNAIPQIEAVFSIDNYYHILWNTSLELPIEVTGYRVYKETSYANQFELIYECGLETAIYVDSVSNASQGSSRYAISYLTTYGESAKSVVHQGLHVMINRGLANIWNLAWMKYEGREVSSYRIWRGTSVDEMQQIAEISGNITSYSDLIADTTYFYAVEILFAESNTSPKIGSRASSRNAYSYKSNVVSTQFAHQVSEIESISIIGSDIDLQLSETSQLYAYVNPYYASYQVVNWVIEEGSHLASINSGGLLVAKGNANGKVKVRAYALDGTGVYAEKTINISGYEEIPESVITPNVEKHSKTQKVLIDGKLFIKLPDGSLYDLTGKKMN